MYIAWMPAGLASIGSERGGRQLASLRSRRPRSRALEFLRVHLGDHWAIGDRIPGELELADHLGISRGTVRAALKELEAEGLIAARRGAGRVVTPAATNGTGHVGSSRAHAAAGRLMERSVIFARVARAFVADNAHAVEQSILNAFAARGNPVVAIDFSRVGGEELDRLVAGRPLGLVAPHVAGTVPEIREKVVRLADAGVRVVAQGDDPPLRRFDRVISDHAAGMTMLVEHLRSRGCRRLVQVRSRHAYCPTVPYWARSRYDAFDALAGDGDRVVTVEADLFDQAHDAADRAEFDRRSRLMAGLLVEHLIGDNRADALLFDTDFLCFYAASALRPFGLEPGRDVLLAGYDDYWATSPLRRFEPAFVDVTVNKDEPAAGRVLADLLLDGAEPSGDGPARQPRLRVRRPRLHVADHARREAGVTAADADLRLPGQ